MLRLPVTALGSSFLPRIAPSSAPLFVRPLVSVTPPFFPWFPAAAFPVRPAPLLYAGAALGPNARHFCSTDGLRMERPEREQEPPFKRRKSSEERASGKEENAKEKTQLHRKDKQDKRDKQDKQDKKDKQDKQDKRDKQDKQDGADTDSRDKSQRYFSRDKDVDRTQKPSDPQRTFPNQSSGPASRGQETMEQEEVGGSNLRPKPTNDKQTQSNVHAKPLLRLWQWAPRCCSSPPSPPGVSVGFEFTVMSYNILSQDLLVDNSYLYRHCCPDVLSWDFRLHNLLQEIQQHRADVLCLQEVQEDHFVLQLRPALEALGYLCVYKKRTGNKSDGCAVVYRRSRLSLLSSNPVEFYRRGDALLDRDNVGLVVLLSPASDPASCFCVANTHLLYNPRRGDIKLAQLAILLAEVQRVSRLPDGSSNPVLLCGDFNSTPHSPLYHFLTTGSLEFQDLPIGMVSGQEENPGGQRRLRSPLWSHSLGISSSCQYQDQNQTQTQRSVPQQQATDGASSSSSAVEGAVSELNIDELISRRTEEMIHRWRIEHHLKLRSCYGHRLSPDGRDEITTHHSRTAMTVDYILYTPDSPVGSAPSSSSLPGGRGLELLGTLSLVGRSELEEVNGLPNQSHSSDHLPLLARFRLRR